MAAAAVAAAADLSLKLFSHSHLIGLPLLSDQFCLSLLSICFALGAHCITAAFYPGNRLFFAFFCLALPCLVPLDSSNPITSLSSALHICTNSWEAAQ